MTAARKALEALEAALKASDRRVDLRKFPHANHDFRLEAIAVNLSAPLAAVVRAAMEWRDAADAFDADFSLDSAAKINESEDAMRAALDAFNAAALAQGFA